MLDHLHPKKGQGSSHFSTFLTKCKGLQGPEGLTAFDMNNPSLGVQKRPRICYHGNELRVPMNLLHIVGCYPSRENQNGDRFGKSVSN